ncbi:MAG: thiol-disulfide isomerase [Acidobacteriota bacterium]
MAKISVLLILTAVPALGAAPTYSKDVAPILFRHCADCHHANDIAPMSLLTYGEVKPWAASIREAVLLRKMPPWKADPHIGKWSNDPSLTEAEIDIIKAWVDGGKPEGNPKDLPAAPTYTDGWRAGKPDAVVTIPKFELSAKGADQYSYVTVPTNFTEDRWVVSAELRAGNRKIVHHAHVFVLDAEPAPAAAAKPNPAKEYASWLTINEGTLSWIRPEAPVIDDGCAVDDNGLLPGSKQGDLGNLLSSYLPGRAPDIYPPGTARLIKAGSKLNFQIHYARTTGKIEYDETSVGLIFAKEPPKTVARRMDLGNHMFRIPPNDPNHVVTECHTITKDIRITSLTPHMHLRGKSMRIEATYPDGRVETLLSVPEYNFNWQITYRTQTPIFIPRGTRIKIIGAYDNSANNPLNPDPSKPVRWGAASEMEMMDGWIEYRDDVPAKSD